MASFAFACFVGVLSALVHVQAAADDAIVLPHPTCHYSGLAVLTCTAGNYNIPGNFDHGLLPKNVSIFYMGSQTASLRSCIHNDADPLPQDLPHLESISIYSFEGMNSKRLPLETFLSNVRGQLILLNIETCLINPLGSDFLKGFNVLKHLFLRKNDIHDIDVSAFETRVTLQENILPALVLIKLDGNFISRLDWAVFAPVADSLENLDVSVQSSSNGSLINLTLGRPFKFANLLYLGLKRNRLNFPGRDILDTLTLSAYVTIDLDENAFCPGQKENECACCEADDFIKWTYAVARRSSDKRPNLSFTCGSGVFFERWRITPQDIAHLPRTFRNECCSNSSAPGCGDEPTTRGPSQPNGSDVTISSVIMITFLVFFTLPHRF